MARALHERGDDRPDRNVCGETLQGAAGTPQRGAGAFDHSGDDHHTILGRKICGAHELPCIPHGQAQAPRPDLQKAPQARHELSGKGDHRGDRAGVGRGSRPAGELFWPVCAAVLLRIYRAADALRHLRGCRELQDGTGPPAVRPAYSRHDHDGAEDREEDPGKILGPVHDAWQHISRKPARHDDS